MALYEYHCQACGRDIEKIVSYDNRDFVSCPDCGAKPDRKMSVFSFKFYNPFTKDGEGFTSEVYRPEEKKTRIKHNLSKYDLV